MLLIAIGSMVGGYALRAVSFPSPKSAPPVGRGAQWGMFAMGSSDDPYEKIPDAKDMENGQGCSVSFNGKTPERKAAEAMVNLFTFVACRSIMNEIEGYDNEGGSAHGHPVWRGLQQALASRSMDGKFVDSLLNDEDPEMRQAALRVMDVRAAFAEEVFNWDAVKDHALEIMKEDNADVLRKHLERTVMTPDTD
jgi:hypothetical protein